MTDVWTAEDDAILDARRRAKVTAETVPGGRAEERTSERGTVIDVHAPGAESGVTWGSCVRVLATPGSPEVVMRASIGDRVRAGHGVAVDLALEQANAHLAQWERAVPYDAPPFEYVREGDTVLLQARFCPDELSDQERFWIEREFDSILVNYAPDHLLEGHMEAVHDDDDDDCVCDACLQR